jgi:tetratricopeptide (TPR) repeat protein
MVAQSPGNLGYQFDMTYAMSDLALIARRKGNAAQAVTLYERGLTIRQRVAGADPKNLRAANGVASLHGYLAAAYGDLGRFDRQLAHCREQLRAWERLVPPAQHSTAPQIAVTRIAVAGALLSAAEHQPAPARRNAITEARRLLDAGEPVARAAAAAGARDGAYALELLAQVKAQLKRLTTA